MVLPEGASLLILAFGLLAAAATCWYVYRDARRNEIGRARLWAIVTGGVFFLSVWLFVVVGAPLTGSFVMAITGFVLYGFEREVTNEDERGRGPTGEPFQEE